MKSAMRGALKDELKRLKGEMRGHRAKRYMKSSGERPEDESTDVADNPSGAGSTGSRGGDREAERAKKAESPELRSKVEDAEESANDELIAVAEGKGDEYREEMKNFMSSRRPSNGGKTMRVISKEMSGKKGRGRPRKDA